MTFERDIIVNSPADAPCSAFCVLILSLPIAIARTAKVPNNSKKFIACSSICSSHCMTQNNLQSPSTTGKTTSKGFLWLVTTGEGVNKVSA